MIPQAGTVCNLLMGIPCCGMTHVGEAQIRLEIPYAMGGEATGEIAAQCLENNIPPWQYNYTSLAGSLTQYGSVL
jgi:hypothetical protein